jgi:hypothetical protein
MKQIDYRGGIVRFLIPESWVEEYEDAGGGTFYEDRPGCGTLRLNVITAKKPADAPDAKRALMALMDRKRPATARCRFWAMKTSFAGTASRPPRMVTNW